MVALVVTIVVLLILASISIQGITRTGIFRAAEDTKLEHKRGLIATTLETKLKINQTEQIRGTDEEIIKATYEDVKNDLEQIKKAGGKDIEVGEVTSEEKNGKTEWFFEVKVDGDVYKVGLDGSDYLGKEDELSPVIQIKNATATTNTITATVTTRRNEGGKIEYYIKEKGASKFDLAGTTDRNTFKYTKLKQETTYVIEAVAINTNGKKKISNEYEIKTSLVPKIDSKEIKFASVPNTWTNKSVEVTATLTVDGQNFTLATSKNPTSGWIASNRQIFTENGTMYAALTDGNNYGAAASYEVTNIDTVKPVIKNITATTNTIKITATDEASGIYSYAISDSETMPKTFTTIDNNTKIFNKIFENLKQTTKYYVWVKDVAGNISEVASTKTETVPKLTDANATITKSPNDWTKQEVTATASTTEKNYTLQTKKDNGEWQTTNTQKFTENGTIYARLWDGTNAGEEIYKTITNIDKTAPTATNIEIKNVTPAGYDVYVYGVKDNGSGVNRVQFPTWTEAKGQDDIQPNWQGGESSKGTKQADGTTWVYHVNITEHKTEAGEYNTHIYAYDNLENGKCIGTKKITVPMVKITYDENYVKDGITNKQTVEKVYNTELGTLGTPTRTGYTFAGWFTETAGGTQISSTTKTPVTDTTYYAHWNANPLNFANQTISKTFSTSEQKANITGASNGTGNYTYIEKTEKNYAKSDTNYISISDTTINIAANTPADTYTYVITAKDNNSGVTKDATYTINVARAKTASASASNKTYDGKSQAGVTGTSVTWTGTTFAIDAGTYTANATPDSNHAWSDGTTNAKTITWKINPKSVTATWGANTTFTYNGQPQAPTVSATSGVTGETINVTRTTGTNAGSYTSTASISSVTGGRAKVGNYALSGDTKTFIINKVNATMANPTLATGLVYNTKAQSLLSKAGSASGGTIKYGLGANSTTAPTSWNTSVTGINAGTYFVWSKVDADGNHNGVGAKYIGTVTIAKATVTIPTSPVKQYTYNGKAQAHGYTLPTGTAIENNGTTPSAIDAGTYNIVLKLTSTSNYQWSDKTITNKTINWKINTKPVAVTWGTTTTFTYNGQPQAPTVSATSGVTGETINVTRTTGTNAGSYTSTASISSVTGGRAKKENYTLTGTTKAFKINKVLATNPILTSVTATYDGKAHAITVSGGSGGTINYRTSTDNKTWGSWSTTKPSLTNAGVLYVQAYVKGDGNHNDTSATETATITINKATVTIPTSPVKQYTYNGQAQAHGYSLPTGTAIENNGTTPSAIDAGTYNIVLKLTSTSNYQWSDKTITNKTIKWKINPKSVAVTWGTTTTFTYNGQPQAPTVSATSGVTGETINVTRTTGTNAGSYTSTASISSVTGGRARKENYTLTGTTKAFTINKATVATPTNLAISTAGIVTWSAARNATSYQISIDGNNWTNATSGVDYLNTIIGATGNRTVYVRAINSNANNYTTPSGKASKTVAVYTTTINSNSTNMGTVDTSSYNVISGATFTTSGNKLTIKGITSGTTKKDLKVITATNKTGYSFSKWSVASGTTTAATTITATFTANTYTVAYNGNGATGGGTANSSHTYNSAKALTTNGFTRTGYTFAGWNTQANGSGTNYSDNQSVTNLSSTQGATVTLYALWTKVSHKLTVNPNGGTYAGSTSNKTYTQKYGTTVNVVDPTRTGYTFGGWALTKEENNATWIEVMYHNPTVEGFGNEAGAKSKNTLNAYSQLGQLANMKYNNQYEFMIKADEASGYNRWIQTNNPVDTTTVTGYKAVQNSWNTSNFAGLVHCSGETLIAWTTSTGNWWYAIGMYKNRTCPIINSSSLWTTKPVHFYVRAESNLSNIKTPITGALDANKNMYIRDEDVTLKAVWIPNQLNFANQTINKTFSTSLQTANITGASNGTGSYTYIEKTEKNYAKSDTNYISISDTTINIAANTPADTYTYVITAKDNNSGVKKDATYTINVARAKTASANASNKTYNGTSQKGVTGSSVTWSGTTSATDAGTYTAKATPDSNHAWSDGTTTAKEISWTMNKKTVAVSWGTTTTFNYNGSAQAPTATASSGISGEVINIKRTTGTNVGSYTSTASISSVSGGRAKAGNYKLSGNTKAFSINKVAAVNPTLTAVTATYDGKAHAVTVSGGSGGTINYRTSTDNKTWGSWSTTKPSRTSTGKTYVQAYVVGDANHNNTSATTSVALTINSKSVAVTWSNTTKEWTGSAQQPSASVSSGVSGETIKLSLSGSVTNVGSGTITASIESVTGGQANKTNYKLTNASTTLKIQDTKPATLSSINVTSPIAGIYKAGTTITIAAKYNENIYGTTAKAAITATTAPVLKIKFGSSTERIATFNSVSGNTIKYTYKIVSGDNGALATTSYTGKVYDQAGNLTTVSNKTIGGNAIKADTVAPTINSLTSANWTNSSNGVVLTGKATDTYAGISYYQFSTNSSLNASSGGWTAITNTTSQITQTYSAKSDNTTYYFYVKDAANNVTKTSVVAKLDKVAPTISTDLSGKTDKIATNLNLSIGVADSTSGLSKIIWYYKKSTDTTYSSVTDTYTTMNGATAGTKTTVTKTKKLTGLTANTKYNIYAVVYDVAGNKKQSSTVNISTPIAVAEIGTTKYAKLEYAIEKATTSTIKMLSNTKETVTIGTGKNVTIDLNNKTINGKLYNDGTLTISGTGNIKGDGNAITNHSTGTLNIKGGTFDIANIGWTINNEGTMNMSGGTIQHTPQSTNEARGCALYSAKKLNITGGTISANAYGISVHNGTATISNATIKATKLSALLMDTKGTVTVKNTTIKGTGETAVSNTSGVNNKTFTSCTISGKTFGLLIIK